ncbi:hypothetical protein [Desulfococcus sp.]|uniref:hypothetical protein n=1 Tax=Desulfococcus sp. TaxID=2025834 RepID=UPI0035946F36
MKKIVCILGMVTILFGIVTLAAGPATSATSDSFADYENTDPVRAGVDAPREDAVLEEEGEMPQDEFISEEEDGPIIGDEEYEEFDPEPSAEEPEETRQ